MKRDEIFKIITEKDLTKFTSIDFSNYELKDLDPIIYSLIEADFHQGINHLININKFHYDNSEHLICIKDLNTLKILFDKKIALPRLEYITHSVLSNEYEKINLMVNYLPDEDTALNSRALKLLYFYYQIYENQKDNKKYKITRESIKILCQKKHNYFNTPFNDFIENEIKPEIRKEQLDNNIRGF